MKRPLLGAALSCTLMLFLSCGKKGPIQLPLVRAPLSAEAPSLVQRGDKIYLEWANPTAYADGSPLTEIAAVEVWLLEQDKPPLGAFPKVSPEIFKSQARLAVSLKKEDVSPGQSGRKKNKSTPGFVYSYPLGAAQTASKRLTFALKIRDKKGRESEFSKLLPIEPKSLPQPPQNLKLAVSQDQIELNWEAPPDLAEPPSAPKPAGYNVYRSEGEEPPRLINSTIVKEPSYLDKGFEFGKEYRYFVRASITESSPFFESDDSEHLEVRPEDKFPPAVPTGLLLLAGQDFIALSWAPNPERDLAGYRVWRKAEGEADFSLLTPEPITENSYTDRAIEKGKRYDYAISAADKSGNESLKSEAVSEVVKEGKS